MSTITQRRVVITGLGLISPLGITTDAFWSALTAGQSGVRALEQLPAQLLAMPWAAEARDFT
jgi:3-oxoacyl-(acyl-carrier-protein) synthase